MEFEGEPIFLSNPQDRIKNLLRAANGKDNEIRSLKSALQETQELLAAANERISRLLGEHSSVPRIANAKKRLKKKYPGMNRKPQPKRVLSPEMKAKMALNMAKAREKRNQDFLARQTASAET